MPFIMSKSVLKQAIKTEQKFRENLDRHIASTTQKLYYNEIIKLVGEGKCVGNISGVMKLMTEKEELNVKDNLADYTTKRKYSLWKEKLWRYAYNMDLPNVIKYHEKMTTYERVDMDRVGELVFDGVKIGGIEMSAKGHRKESTGEQTYKMLCDEYKKRYGIGKDLVSIYLISFIGKFLYFLISFLLKPL